MNDPASMARTARERLAQALGALQAPGVPPQLLDAAEPVAQAMSALHRIETGDSASPRQHAPAALDAVRRALASVQAHVGKHPAVDRAIEGIAGSLNLVHQLTTGSRPPPAGDQPLELAGTMVADASQFSQRQGPPPMAAHQQYARPAAAAAAPANHAPQFPQQPAPQYASQQQVPNYPSPQAAPPPQAVPQQAAPAPAHVASDGSLPKFDAELGAHSPANFYKGLSGNDIIDSGGIFIATYQPPKIGTQLLIHVSMPGGYEFVAKGVVRWTRDAPQSGIGGSGAPPGFGAQFTEITPEGRQLVYRYVRNREPLFHDDL